MASWLLIVVIDVIGYSLITYWLPIDYSSITNIPPASASNMEKPIFIEMMFTLKIWSYNTGKTDSSKKTLNKLSPLGHMQTKWSSQQFINTFHFWLYMFINFVMITN